MRIVRSLQGTPLWARGAAVALGNFDGVHRGHQVVLRAARDAARQDGCAFGVLTFEPHPRTLFRPEAAPFRLTPFRGKALRLREEGVEVLYVGHFTRAFSRLSARAFVEELLVGALGVRHVAVGQDFVFGQGRGGNASLLREMAQQGGFGLSVVAPAGESPGALFKSSAARTLLTEGRPRDAAEILGAWWRVTGRVRHGDARGRTLGYPTANIALGPLLRPRFGIYAVWASIEGEASRPAVASLGLRPMFQGDVPLLEVHLFDFAGDLYGRHLCVDVVEFLRPEQTFTDVAALVRQMDADSARARAILADPDNAAGRFRRGAP